MSTTNQSIYQSSLRHIGIVSDSTQYADYEERAPYLLANFCSAAKSVDKRIRKLEGLSPAPSFSPVFISLDKDFPLCDALIPSAVLYLAAMLSVEEDSELSDSLYDKYCDSIASLSAEAESASFENGSTVQKYFSN